MSTLPKSTTAVPIEPAAEPVSIAKPSAFNLDAFKSTRNPNIAGVETLLTALPVKRMSEVKDWVRLHPDQENYWSPEFCFVSVPVQGQQNIEHLIAEHLADQFLSANMVQRYSLALAAMPHDKFFLCKVPTQNLENSYNQTNRKGCVNAIKLWTMLISLRSAGLDKYDIKSSKDPDAFPEPNWPAQSLLELISVTYTDRQIIEATHPGLLRLIGARQSSE